MRKNICFFIGHRDTPDSIYPDLLRTVEEHISRYGVTECIVGHYGNFDRLAARAVMEVKVRYPEVVLTMLLPYHPSEQKVKLPVGFDGSWYPPEMETVPRRVAIVRANRCAIDRSTHLIAYVRHPASHAWELVQYGQQRLPNCLTLL